ncbi:MAG: ABC transporter substrate-binding protein [Eubacteriales bacterium]|nr:ABC transporter substrate-binding protein [Eubacteriales bacterium]
MKSRRVWSLITAAAVAAMTLSGCGSASGAGESAAAAQESGTEAVGEETSADASEGTVVRIQVSRDTVCGAPMQIAAELGYFDEELAKVGQSAEVTVAASSETVDLLTSDQIDAAFGLASNFITPISNGLAVSFVTGVHKGCTKFYTKSDSGITDLEGLRGKTVGVPSLSDSSTLSIKRKLADLGFVVNGADADVQFVAYAMSDLALALDNGAVDAIGVHEPMGTRIESAYDVVKILDTGEDEKFADEYCCMALVTQDMIQNNPEGAAAFARAVQKGAAYVQANPEEAARIQIEKGYVSGDPEENAQIIRGLDFHPSVEAGRTTFSNAFSDLQATGDIDAGLNEAEFTERVFPVLEGVPETTVYDAESGTFTTEE